MTAPPRPFAIVADMRTGSTLLSASLDQHPEIRCYGELFHPEDLPDNLIEGVDRRALDTEALLRAALDVPGVRAVGFKAMVFLPLEATPQWTDLWTRLRALEGLRVLYLERRDTLAQYTSLVVAQETGVFHPYDNDDLYDPENRPTVYVDPEAYRAWVEARRDRMARRRQQLAGLPGLELTYEALCDDWEATMRRVQDFLDVPYHALEQRKQKQETRPLSSVIENFEELSALTF